jgi:hypothetical protein
MTSENTARDFGSPMAMVLALLRTDAPGAIIGAPEDWPRWADLLPHVLAATSCLAHDQALFGPAGDDAAWLLDRAATYLQVHGRLTEAQPLVGPRTADPRPASLIERPDAGPACLGCR